MKEDIRECQKCTAKYRVGMEPKIKYVRAFKEFWDEHLEWVCVQCGHSWQTETLDKYRNTK